MTNQPQYFHDQTGVSQDRPLDLWPPVVIPKEQIDAEIERLAALPSPNNGRREAHIVHPGRASRASVWRRASG
jgi:gentisate 1,2-dioxygenase